ncbi:unnamed protein product [Rotaria sp. Silwood1]|nr:unnamed protein product [Rotaria sp. Silwood1]
MAKSTNKSSIDESSDIIERKAINSNGHLGCLYDGTRDRIIDKKGTTVQEQWLPPTKPAQCEIINSIVDSQPNLLQLIDVEPELRLSLLLNLATRPGIAQVLNYSQPIDHPENSTTRVLVTTNLQQKRFESFPTTKYHSSTSDDKITSEYSLINSDPRDRNLSSSDLMNEKCQSKSTKLHREANKKDNSSSILCPTHADSHYSSLPQQHMTISTSDKIDQLENRSKQKLSSQVSAPETSSTSPLSPSPSPRSSSTPCFYYFMLNKTSYCAPGILCSILEPCNNITFTCASATSVCVVNSCCSPQAVCVPWSATNLCKTGKDRRNV